MLLSVKTAYILLESNEYGVRKPGDVINDIYNTPLDFDDSYENIYRARLELALKYPESMAVLQEDLDGYNGKSYSPIELMELSSVYGVEWLNRVFELSYAETGNTLNWELDKGPILYRYIARYLEDGELLIPRPDKLREFFYDLLEDVTEVSQLTPYYDVKYDTEYELIDSAKLGQYSEFYPHIAKMIFHLIKEEHLPVIIGKGIVSRNGDIRIDYDAETKELNITIGYPGDEPGKWVLSEVCRLKNESKKEKGKDNTPTSIIQTPSV